MCDHCKILGKSLVRNSTLVEEKTDKIDVGFKLAMFSDTHTNIIGGQQTGNRRDGRVVNYLKAWEFDKENNRAHHIAVQIYYCPFCGEKL
jgi:hypothetical protein